MGNLKGADLKKVYVAFYSGDSFVQRAIRWLTNSHVNHVAIIYESTDWQTDIAIEAEFNGVIVHQSKRQPKHVFRIDDQSAFDNLRFILNNLGEFYDYIGLLKFGVVLLWWKIFKKKLRQPTQDTKGQFCSELVARYLKCFPEIEEQIGNPQYSSPEDLLEVCKNNPGLFLED